MKVFSAVKVSGEGVNVCRALGVVAGRPFWEDMLMVPDENEVGFGVDVVMYVGLDVEKTNEVVEPILNVLFGRVVYDAEFDLVRVAKLTVVILDANELLELVNIDGALDR